MQFPGMSTDPVRLSLDVTWYPPTDDFAVSRRLWTRPSYSDTWLLEDMATTGSPVRLVTLPPRWASASAESLRLFLELVQPQMEPFPDLER